MTVIYLYVIKCVLTWKSRLYVARQYSLNFGKASEARASCSSRISSKQNRESVYDGMTE